ncbi:MAG: PKD domain-containing protein, partial [Flavobacteriales bacterium]
PGEGWDTTSSAQCDNPCDASIDGGTYLWMGNNSGAPRELVSEGVDVSCGGEICFWMDFAKQGDASPCEGPDEPDEGVYFEYSTDGGTSWNTVEYYGPCGPGNDTDFESDCGGGTMTSWQQFCFEIPSGAETDNTKFRWIQSATTSNDNDHWGIDNVTINGLVNCDPYVYDWDHISGSPDDSAITETVTSDTTFTVTYTNDTTDSCSSSISVNVPTGNIVPNFAPIDTISCTNQTVDIDASGSTPTDSITFSWSPTTNIVNSNADSSIITVDDCGSYTLTITDTTDGCTYDTTVSVVCDSTSPTADIVPVANQCESGNSFTFDGSGSTPSDFGSITNYCWDFGDGNTQCGANDSIVTHSYSSDGTYTVQLIVENDTCEDTTSITLTVFDQPSVTADSTDVTCFGNCDGAASATVTGGGGGNSFDWFDSGGSLVGTGSSISGLCPDTYKVIVTDANGCQDSATTTVTQPTELQGSADADTTTCNGICDGTITAGATGGTSPYE